jgi:ubiquinone/menaquinone biosynthesis C-methylase UbiE
MEETMRTLTAEEAKSFYDRFGGKQDSQAFYEDAALKALVANAAFERAQSVFEFGCGTGRFASELLQSRLPSNANYFGIDLSTTMVKLATERLARFGSRAVVAPATGALPLENASIDRFVSTYVLDLLPEQSQHEVIAEARRALRPDGLLCLVGVTPGVSIFSKIVMGGWQWLFSKNPAWVGGCRPTRLAEQLADSEWVIRFHAVIVAWGVASEVVVAAPSQT